MFSRFRQSLIVPGLFMFGVLPLISQTTPAGEHIVPAPDLRQAVRTAAQARQGNLAKVEKFFSSEPAKQALETVKLDPSMVSYGISFLSDEELARLATKSEKMQNDIAAGALNNQQITYILIALATAVIILVIVAAR